MSIVSNYWLFSRSRFQTPEASESPAWRNLSEQPYYLLLGRLRPLAFLYIENGAKAKSGLNKAILDASWGELKQKIRVMSEKVGVMFYEVNPKHTSQECSCCHYISPTNRDKERFLCERCGFFSDAATPAALNIRERGLKELGINLFKLPGVPRKVRPLRWAALPT